LPNIDFLASFFITRCPKKLAQETNTAICK
jgi:hypothetical protein